MIFFLSITSLLLICLIILFSYCKYLLFSGVSLFVLNKNPDIRKARNAFLKIEHVLHVMSFNEHLKLFLAVLLHELQVLVFEIILHVIIESYFSICVFKTIS